MNMVLITFLCRVVWIVRAAVLIVTGEVVVGLRLRRQTLDIWRQGAEL